MNAPATSPNRALILARRILVVGFLINIAYCAIAAAVFDLDYPHTTFLFRPLDRFQDFYTVLRSTEDLEPYRIRQDVNVPGHPPVEVSNYFPWTHVVLYPFTLIDQQLALFIFLGLYFAGVTWAVLKICYRAGARGWSLFFYWLAFVPMNYPILFSADRGNIECWLFLGCAFAIYLISTGKRLGGAACLGLAAAAKGFPLIFLLPLLCLRQWKAVLLSGLVAASVTIVSLFCFSGGFEANVRDLFGAFGVFGNFVLAGVNGITHSISLFSGVYVAVIWWNQALTDIGILETWRFYYGILAGLSLLAIVLYIWLKKPEPWKQWALLVVAVELLPHPSYDYKLLYSLIPLTFLILKNDRRLDKYVWLLSLTIVPKVPVLFSDVRISVVINPILILSTALLIVWDGRKAKPTPS